MNVVTILLFLISSHYSLGDRQGRLLVDYDIRQIQLEMQSLRATLTSLENEVQTQKGSIKRLTVSAGTVFTRWGRLDCPSNGTTLVYTGLAAGGNHDDYGAAADYVCLPHNPDLNLNLKSSNGDRAVISGAEYQDNAFGNTFQDKDVPCAVCLSNTASSVLMIPGKSVCVGDWKMEYHGLLASQGSYASYFHAAGQYVCVDHAAQTLEGGSEHKNGKLFYPVHAKCGSLRCPPYVDEALLPCVVC